MKPLEKLSSLRAAPRGKGRVKTRYGQMNKLEARYAGLLDEMMATGAIIRWDFEPEKLRLADGAYYTPDFRVVANDLTIEFHECKGFMREAAHVRLKVAADQHPYVFRLVRWVNKQWDIHTL